MADAFCAPHSRDKKTVIVTDDDSDAVKREIVRLMSFLTLSSGLLEHYQRTGERPTIKALEQVVQKDTGLMRSAAGRKVLEDRTNRWKKIITETPSLAEFMIGTAGPVMHVLYEQRGDSGLMVGVLVLTDEMINLWEEAQRTTK